MTIGSIAKDMRARMPWDVGKRILAANGVPKGHGWDKTVERLQQHEDELKAHADALSAALQEHYVCGEKLSRFYELERSKIEQLRDSLAEKKPPKNEFSDAYPSLLDDAGIDETYQKPHVLAAVEKNEDGIAAIFASSRAVFIRESVDTDAFPELVASKLAEYDEIVGVKLMKYQAMDVVWVPHTGRLIDVRVDFPRGMHHDQGLAAQEATRNAFHQLCGQDVLAAPVNLFPLIELIYKQANEGNVVEMAFGTTTASLKHEKMRRAKTDLRKELYHQGGKKALKTPIEPYRLSVEYELHLGEIGSSPEVTFAGSARMTGSTNPSLYEVTVRKCAGLADYEHVRSRIRHFIQVHKAAAKKK